MLKHPRIVLFTFFWLLYFCAGGYLAYELKIFHNDAVARTALGFFTAFGRNPHLAAVGFVWQPLPSLLQVPLLFVLRPIGLQMLAGALVASIVGAAGVVTLYNISELFEKKKHRYFVLAVTLLYGLNPMIVLYAAMGSSETLFITSTLIFTYCLLKWLVKKHQIDLVLASFFLATAFGSRYESLPTFMMGMIVILGVLIVRKEKADKIEGSVIQFAVPFLYTVLMWIIANWAIMGNPFYFLNSIYSNVGFTTTLKENTAGMENTYHSLFNTMWYSAQRVLLLAPGLALLPTLLWLNKVPKIKQRVESWLLIGTLITPYLAILAFHMYQLYKGESFGWLRFFMYSIVAVTLMSMFMVKKLPKLRVIVLASLLLGYPTTVYAMSQNTYGKEENSFVRKIVDPTVQLDFTRTYADQQAVATYMDSKPGTILIDTDEAFAVPLFAKDPTRYIITSDTDYEERVRNYQSSAQWVIVPAPNQDNVRKNVILRNYPDIWNGRAPNLKFDRQIDGWGIFEVLKD